METSGRISVYFNAIRGLDRSRLCEYLRKSLQESILDTFLLIFHCRDCRGGKGERDIGRWGLIWLLINCPTQFLKVLPLIPTYGRWDDIMSLWPGSLDLSNTEVWEAYDTPRPHTLMVILLCDIQMKCVTLMADQLRADRGAMFGGRVVTLCAKWAPTEGDALDRRHHHYRTLYTTMGCTPRELRREYITPLRKYLQVVETLMCGGKWDSIDFSSVPSHTMRRLKKALVKHVPTALHEWKEKLNEGMVKVNALQLYPHELIRDIYNREEVDSIMEAQWEVLLKQAGELTDALFVVDVSGSMSYGSGSSVVPLHVSVAMGLLGSAITTGPFHNHVITFDGNPTFQVINGTLSERARDIRNIPWGGNTNIQATFELILRKATEFELPPEDMPKKIFIISDMQFDQTNQEGKTNFQDLEEQYAKSNYTRPQLIFWNVNGTTTDFPVQTDDEGTAMISGFSTSILRTIMRGVDFNPYSILRETIDHERFDSIRRVCTPLRIV